MYLFEIVFLFSGYMPRSRIVGSYDNSIFSIFKEKLIPNYLYESFKQCIDDID